MYQSTRGMETVHASQAIMKGIATDGGLFSMVEFPQAPFLDHLIEMDYLELSNHVLTYFLDDFRYSEIRDIVNDAYSKEFFPEQIVGLEPLKNDFLMTLYHGPTFAFKDMALSMFSSMHAMSKNKQDESKKTIILSATSGDTGSAVLSGFKRDNETEVVIFYPYGKITPFQEKQMHSFASDKRHLIAIEGNFDDCQSLIKTAFQKIPLKNSIFSSANSINIARIIPQVIYYFWSYGELCRRGKIKVGEAVNFVVPTGNFGNVLAGYYAYRMGLFVNKFIVASNENNVLTDFFSTGTYDQFRPFIQTTSPSMDILISSNLERLLYEACDHDAVYVKTKMDELNTLGKYEVNNTIREKLSIFHGESLSVSEVKEQIKQTYRESDLLVDPHTAVGIGCLRNYQRKTKDDTVSIVLSTASPVKFLDAVLDAFEFHASDSPQGNLNLIKAKFDFPIDPREKSIFTTRVNRVVWKKEKAFGNLVRLVGEIDV